MRFGKKIGIILISLLLLISIVSAEGTSIILDNTEQTTQMSGQALVLASIIVFVFAALIIIKILLMGRGE